MAIACIAVLAGATLTVLPTQTLTLRWMHTVEKTFWEETYSATDDGLVLTEARIEALGAGMEPPAFAIRQGREWRYRPSLSPLRSVDLANSVFAPGYSICWQSRCRPLAALVPQGTSVSIVTSNCDAGVAAAPIEDR